MEFNMVEILGYAASIMVDRETASENAAAGPR